MASHKNEEEQVDTLTVILKAVQENVLMIIGGIAVLVALVMAGFLFNVNKIIQEKDQATDYAAALDIKDPQERATALAVVADTQTKYTAEALYMEASAAMEAADYDTAKAAYTKLIDRHPSFEFTPDAAEGLGEILQTQEDYTGAIARYEEVVSTWPNSFTAQRQSYNIGVCQEKNGALKEAITAYKHQLEIFVGSSVAQQAQQKLNLLYVSHPELKETEALVEAVVETTPAATLDN